MECNTLVAQHLPFNFLSVNVQMFAILISVPEQMQIFQNVAANRMAGHPAVFS
jgi:hypothetical protein